jgi:hypothetical protein
MAKKRDYILDIENQASKWNHTVLKITGPTPVRRSKVLWFCNEHPRDGKNSCSQDDEELKNLREKNKENSNDPEGLSQKDVDDLIQLYSGQRFYSSRMDEYLKERKYCCSANMYSTRTKEGFDIFKKLLEERGKHYKTKYILLFDENNYKGKRVKHTFKCQAHGISLNYSMQELNTITSCPCPECRKDPNHKNVCVDIVKKRNAGRAGQVIRHATKVKQKYNNTCALSGSTFSLQHHHLDGQDFYEETALNWDANGICLCAAVHRDYHYNFLKTYSIIKNEYKSYFYQEESDVSEYNEPDESKELNVETNPDFYKDGVEVSRYTFLEYLKFLISDIKHNNSTYVNRLNEQIKSLHASLTTSNPSCGNLGQITLDTLETAIAEYCREYKGENWVLSDRTDIPFANDPKLWDKVDAL